MIPTDECWQLVKDTPVGRVAFLESGDMMILPVNHGVVGHRVAFRTATGAMLHEALLTRSVAFEVDAFDPAEREGWSVLIRGQARLPEETDELDALELDAWADAVERNEWVVILAEEISGRRIVHRSTDD